MFWRQIGNCCLNLDIVCNTGTTKTICVIFVPKNKDRWITDNFPAFTMLGCKLTFVSQFKYLGHIINNNLHDSDINRKLKTFL